MPKKIVKIYLSFPREIEFFYLSLLLLFLSSDLLFILYDYNINLTNLKSSEIYGFVASVIFLTI